MRVERTSHDAQPPALPPFGLDVLAHGGPDIVIPEADADIKALCEDEAFMKEPIQIRFLDDSNPNSTKAVELELNTSGITGKPTKDSDGNFKPGVAGRGGTSQKRVFQRGKVYTVERRWWEVACHAKVTTMTQVDTPNGPVQVTRNTFSYPFECIRDDNPKGRAWREMRWNDPA